MMTLKKVAIDINNMNRAVISETLSTSKNYIIFVIAYHLVQQNPFGEAWQISCVVSGFSINPFHKTHFYTFSFPPKHDEMSVLALVLCILDSICSCGYTVDTHSL